MHYTGLHLDRAADRRTDAGWIAELEARPDSRVIPLWRDKCLLRDGKVVGHQADVPARSVLDSVEGEPVLLGLEDGRAVFTADLSPLTEAEALATAAGDAMEDVRRLVPSLTVEGASLLAYARGLLHWHRNQRYCGACGEAAVQRDGGHLRTCGGCGKLLFPRIEPAVIVLVEHPGDPARCLLARHAGAGAGAFSTLAGFVEVGENLEDAVRREVMEEAGVRADEVVYQGSQAWPFPAGLMVGFRARASSRETAVDGVELKEARWFTAAGLRSHIEAGHGYRQDSIGKLLIESWIAENTP
ncbi:hypothetical protein N566_20850 [Streptomycetaceae bacterium MP113-05]|nr:hypothetical protein N566_20850 [Streptomycetaceae bacterium MP113-05]